MFTCLLFRVVRSGISVGMPNPKYSTQPNHFDIIYTYQDKLIDFSFFDQGTSTKLIVDDQEYEPKKLSPGPYGGLILDVVSKEITPNAANIKFIITNTNNKTVKFRLGTYTDIAFKSDKGEENTIEPLVSKIRKGEQTGVYAYAISSTVEPSWQKLVIDHYPFIDVDFIKPDHFWYGKYSEITNKSNKWFMNFSQYKQLQPKSPEGSDDLVTSYSWNERSIGSNQTIVYGIHIYFIMEKPLDIIAEEYLVPVELGKKATLHPWMRLLTKGQKYKLTCLELSSNNIIKTAEFPASFAMDHYGIDIDQNSEQGETKYKLYFEDVVKKEKSNEIIITVTRSTKPNLTVTETINNNPYLNQSDVINVSFTAKSKLAINISAELYDQYDILRKQRLTEYQTSNKTSETVTDRFIYELKDLRSGKYCLRLRAINSMGLSSDPSDINFTMNFATQILQYGFESTVLSPKEAAIFKVRFSETDVQQTVKFSLQIQGSTFNSSEIHPNGLEQIGDFVVEIPDINEGKYKCTFEAYVDGEKLFSDENIEISISAKPQIKIFKKYTGNEFTSSDELAFTVEIKDENSGNISLIIKNKEVYRMRYQNAGLTGTNYSINFKLNDYSYSEDPYPFEVYVVDSYNIKSNPIKDSFTILSKPSISSIQMPNVSSPRKPVDLYLNFIDHDSSKQLWLIYTYETKSSKETYKVKDFYSQGNGTQYKKIEFTYPGTSNGTITFYLTSLQTIPENLDNLNLSISNGFPMQITSTDSPEISVYFPVDGTNYGSNETINFNLTIFDDDFGSIKYLIDDREDINSTGLPPDYNMLGSKSITKEIKLYFPSWCKFLTNNGEHKLSVYVMDHFGLKSKVMNHSFQIRNKPIIEEIQLSSTLINYDTNKEIKINGSFIDYDEGKTIVFRVKEGESFDERYVQAYGNTKSNGGGKSFNFNYEFKKPSATNLKLIIWIEDDYDISRDKHNGESEPVEIMVNISKSPRLYSQCPIGSFGGNDEYPLVMEIRDETNGKIVVYLDGSLVKEIPYNATIIEYGQSVAKINTTYTIPNNLSRTSHNITYYPVDEFGFEATSIWRKNCNFQYKSRPILSDLKLNRTQIDNDEPVNISGNITDYDSGKTIYIMQRIENQSAIPIGNITSNGRTKDFSFDLANLVAQSSGNRTITFWASDSNNSAIESTSDHNMNSEPVHLYLFWANDPDFTINFPNGLIYSPSETITIEFNVTTDLSGSIYFVDYGNYLTKYHEDRIYRVSNFFPASQS